ncbi:hypothetical protein CQW23_07942 [Capsicum baccatum]|uniref:Uncharacterized protein n=1 Tax=Capsicum baccatum TaxID=33114 RepID=A0A2G2X7N6_CAPBA|nr:hypothetical protein CQW23_07942 [Capsicum baccatum]
MESRPSFNLGVTQFQSTSNEINISGFVPGNFDYKDVDFRENSSKYQNDPTIMKKLRDTASAKGKKPAVAISKGKKKESCEKRTITKGDEIRDQNYFTSSTEYVYTNISPTVDKMKCLQFPNHAGMNLKDSVNSTLPSTSCRQQTKVGQKAIMTVDSLPLDDFDDFTKPSPPGLLTKSKVRSDRSLAPPSKRRKIDAERKESVTALMEKHHEEMKKQHEEMMLAVKKKHDAPQKESETEVKNVAFQHFTNNTIAEIFSPVIAIQSNDLLQKENLHDEILQKENLPDLILARDNIKVRNKPQVSNTEISSDAFQESIDNIIDGMYTSVVAMAINSDDLSQKVNLSDPFLQTDNVEVSNEPQESIDNIIAEIFTSVVAMKINSVSPKEINNSECHIHDSRFPSVLPEADLVKQDAIKTCAPRNKKRAKIFMSSFTTEFGSSCKGKESATVDFSRKHLFDGYLLFHDRPTGLIEQYCGWIVEGLLKCHEKKKLKDNHYRANKSGLNFDLLNFIVAQPASKN